MDGIFDADVGPKFHFLSVLIYYDFKEDLNTDIRNRNLVIS